ncbi:MAG: alpha/beta hydrolase [Planctomycetota bacterium]
MTTELKHNPIRKIPSVTLAVAAIWLGTLACGNAAETDRSARIATAKSTEIPESMAADLDVVYATLSKERALRMDVFRLRALQQPAPAILVVHGGGWLKGDKSKFRALALRLAERGYVTAAVEYRLGGEARFPAAIRDCNTATAFMRANAARYGVDPDRISAVGGSAGGHLVGLMAAGHEIPGLRHEQHLPNISAELQAVVVMAGPLEIITGSVAQKSTGPDAKSNAIEWIGGSLQEKPQGYRMADVLTKIDASMPPTLFLCGSLDNPERNEAARQAIRSHGGTTELIVHDDAKHGHWNRPEWIPRVVDDIDGFLTQHLNR